MNTVIKRVWNKNKLVKVEDLTGMTFQAESGGHTFEISGVDDTGATVSLSGTAEGRFLRADNAEIIISGTVSGGKASVTLSAACYAIPGRFLLTVYVTSGGQKVAVYAATGSVVATSGTASGSIPPLVTDSVQTNSIQTTSINVSGNAAIGKINNFLSIEQIGVGSGQTADINIPNSSAIYMLMSGVSIAIHGICIARANGSGNIAVSSFSRDGGTLAVTFTTSQNTLTVNNGGAVFMFGLIFRT